MRPSRRIEMPSGRDNRSQAARATGSGPAKTGQIGRGGGTGASHSLDDEVSEIPPPIARAHTGTAQRKNNNVTASGTTLRMQGTKGSTASGENTARVQETKARTSIRHKASHRTRWTAMVTTTPNKVGGRPTERATTPQGGRPRTWVPVHMHGPGGQTGTPNEAKWPKRQGNEAAPLRRAHT